MSVEFNDGGPVNTTGPFAGRRLHTGAGEHFPNRWKKQALEGEGGKRLLLTMRLT